MSGRTGLRMSTYLVFSFVFISVLTGLMERRLESVNSPIPPLAVGITGVTVVAVLMAYLANRALKALMAVVEAISRGEMGQRARVGGLGVPLEFAHLAERVNMMADRLERMQQELLEINATLEHRVEERNREVLDRNRELTIFNTIAKAVNEQLNLEDVLRQAVETTTSLFDGSTGSIVIVDDQGNLAPRIWHTPGHNWLPPKPEHFRNSFTAEVIRTGQPVLVDNLQDFPDKLGGFPRQTGLKCLACVPIRLKGSIIGSLNVARMTPKPFTQDDVRILTSVGAQIGLAVENARLFERAVRDNYRLLGILDSMGEGLALISNNKVELCNRAFGEMFGVDPATVPGQPEEWLIEKVVALCVDQMGVRASFQAANPAHGRRMRFDAQLAGKPTRYIDVQGFPVTGAEGELMGFGYLIRDITRKKELDQLKSTLISTVSHEIRTPLTAIKGSATSLLREDVQWDEATKREFLQDISEECDRLKRLVDDILDMSRIDSGMLRLDRRLTSLEQLVQKVVGVARRRYPGFHFTLAMEAGLPPVEMDEARIMQVLHNLIDNAVKYSGDSRQIDVAVAVSPQTVEVSVADHGVGIPADQLTFIFDRFHRLEQLSAGGAGLGLAICRGIVLAHGGKIWAESALGKGSTFRFTLPRVGCTKPPELEPQEM